MHADKLNAAFENFAAASKSLETYYGELKDRIARLTGELEIRNAQLNDALAETGRSKDHLNAVLQNLEEAIVALDPDGNVTMMNRSAEEMLCATLVEAAGRPFTDLRFTLRGEGTDTLLETASGKRPVIVSHSDVRGADNHLQGRVVLIKDVTHMRELEQRNERNQRLIAMGEMAAKLVHEIRNPLCSIELFASMLEHELKETKQQEMARGIATGIGSLNTIMTNMLFFARPNKAAKRRIRLDAVVQEALRMLAPMIASRGVVLTQRVEACEADADAEMLKQVFMNIIINAVQATPAGGTLAVGIAQEGDEIAARIRDSGCGIPRENIERIFDPFFTTKDAGTGLGLVIAANIMQANNGYIQVTSEPGQGSEFVLRFPVVQHADAEEPRVDARMRIALPTAA